MSIDVNLRPIASPLPIGMLTLAVGSFVLSGRQLGWVGVPQSHAVALCILVFVVPLQLLSCTFAVLGRDEGTASGLAVLSGSWAATGFVTELSRPGSRSTALGLLLLAAAVALIVPASVTAASKPLVSAVVVLIAVRFAVTGAFDLSGTAALRTVAGVLGLVVSAGAVYAAAAFALEDAFDHQALPTLRLSGGPERAGTGEHPFGDPTRDAGVRGRL